MVTSDAIPFPSVTWNPISTLNSSPHPKPFQLTPFVKLNVFHGYNFCYSFLGLVPSPSPPVTASVLSFQFFVSSTPYHVLAYVLLFHSLFHLPILRFQLLFLLLTVAFLSSFLSSHLYKYWCQLGGSVEVFLYPNSFYALFFCLMVFFPLSAFVSAYFMMWCGWLLHYVYFLNHFCWGVEFVTAGLFNWSTASFGDFLGWENLEKVWQSCS